MAPPRSGPCLEKRRRRRRLFTPTSYDVFGRLHAAPAQQFDERLRNVHRIAELRLADRFGAAPPA